MTRIDEKEANEVVVRILSLAKKAIVCEHEATVALLEVETADKVKTEIEWCVSCGAVHQAGSKGWQRPNLHHDFARQVDRIVAKGPPSILWLPSDGHGTRRGS